MDTLTRFYSIQQWNQPANVWEDMNLYFRTVEDAITEARSWLVASDCEFEQHGNAWCEPDCEFRIFAYDLH